MNTVGGFNIEGRDDYVDQTVSNDGNRMCESTAYFRSDSGG